MSDDASSGSASTTTVEGEDGCRNQDRLGPYATADEAGPRPGEGEERNEEWDNDPAWNDETQ